MHFSLIIPVFNRPEEIRELLQSLKAQTYKKPFEVVIVEDGSEQTSEKVVNEFGTEFSITYLKKSNTGPGDSRNYGMARARGTYFIVLDSDCLLPTTFLSTIDAALELDYVDCFGGPDAAHPSFSTLQKAINYAMTSVLTTGGIRGGKRAIGKFQPRSFNMGISRQAFESTGGFGNIHPGEDPDLSIRLWAKGFRTKLISDAFVYHKRRIDFSKFFRQVKKFGMVRPILNSWHPHTSKITFWFPTIFCLGFLLAIGSLFLLPNPFKLGLLGLYLLYFTLVFFDALVKTKNIQVAFLSVFAVLVQFLGYGYGFLKSTILVNFSSRKPQQLFPELFF